MNDTEQSKPSCFGKALLWYCDYCSMACNHTSKCISQALEKSKLKPCDYCPLASQEFCGHGGECVAVLAWGKHEEADDATE